MSYYQYPPQMPPQRSYTAGPQSTHSYSQSVPNAYPNAVPNAYSQNMTPGPSGHGFRPIPQQQQQQHHIQQPVQPIQPPRTPSPFRRPLPSPQRTDPIPRSLTPGVSSPTSPPTSSFSNPASTFSLGSAGFTASNSALVRHSHSYSMSDAMQGGSPGSLPSPYPPNWSPSQSQQQQQHQQQIQRYHPQPPPPPQPQYRQSQQPQWVPQSQATAPYQQAPQTAYAAIHGSNPPQLPPINTGSNVRTSMFPPPNVPPTPANPVRTYSQPPSSGNSSPTRRPLPTPGPPSHVTNTSSVFPDRAHARSPSPIKPNPPPRSQSPVKAIRDMFESRNSANSNPPQRASNVGPGALVLHGKAWSEDSDNGFKEAINNEPDRGRSGFSGMTGVRRQSPPKFFGSTDGGDSGPSTVKLISSSERANDTQPRPSAYSALPPAASSQDGAKFVPMWKRGKTFTFDNTPSSRTSTPNNEVQSSSASVYSQNIAGVGAGDNAAAKGRVLPQPTTSQLQSPRRSQESPPAQSKPSPPQVQSQIRNERYQRSQSQTRQPVPETQGRTRSQPVAPPSPTKQPQTPTHSRFPSQSAVTPNQRTLNETRQPELTPTRPPQIRSQPLKSATEIPQPDVRRSRAQPPRHTRSKSHGPPSAHPMPQPMHQQQRSEPVLPRGAPPGWKTTVNIPNLPPSPPVMGMKARSRSAGPPATNPSASRSGSPTKNGRAPNGWRTSVSPNNKPPPPDIDPRTGEVRPPRHKPPEGWRSSVPRGQITQPPLHPSSPKKRAKVLEPEMTSRAPGGWRSTVSNHPPSPVKPSGHSGGPPAGWRSSAYAPPPPATSTTQQKRWSQPAPMSTPKASDRSNYGYGRTSGQYYPETPDGDSSLEYDSTDAYSGIYDDEGDSSFDAVATGDEETDGASVLSRDTGTTAESYDSGYERARAQLPRSPQYGIRELPKSNMSLPQEDALSTHPRSPQYGIRELPPSMRRGDTSNRGDTNSTGPLPRPPVMSRGAVSQNNAPETRPYTQNKAPNYSKPESSYGGSDMTSDTGSRRNSTFSTTSSKNDWPSNVPPLPRAPGMSRSSFGSDNSSTTDRRLAEQRIRRERDRIDLDDAPPVGFSALRRTPSPSAASVSVDDDYDFHTQRREFAPSQAFSSRPSTSQSYRSQASQPELPPRQSSPTRPLPQPSQLQRSRSQRSQANSQYQNTPSVPSTPSSYTTPPSPRQQLPSVPSTPSSRAPPLPPRQIPSIPPSPTTSQIEIQSPAPISGWGRSDLPKIEVNDEPASNSSSAPVIAVSAPSISISGIDDDDDDANGMGPMISVAGPDDAKDDKPAKRPLPPLHRGGGLICGGCGGAIVGRIVSAMGLRWHPGCFKCTICEELLEHVSSYEHEGRPYCHLDYHENFAPKCYSCKTAIIEERFISLDDPALGKRTYHEQHFFCAECGDPFLAPSSNKRSGNNDLEVNVSGDGEFLLDDDVGFTVYKGHPYCEACHVRLRMPKCKKCKKSIRDGMQAVEALGGKWCYECFVCTGCQLPFNDPSFFQRGDKPFCERCFSIILRNEL